MKERDGFGSSTWVRRSGRWAMGAVCILAMGAAVALRPQQADPASPQQGNGAAPRAEPGAGPQAAGAATLATPSPPTGGLNPDAPNAEHREQIAADSARLVKLATELKTEVDKSNKDTLSVSVIRKAEEIEKLAHSVKEKTRLGAGPP
jgi:uncharacterized protein involved in type VI secretion and phage assembly